MTVSVAGVTVLLEEIIAVHIVDISIPVVVDIVAANLSGIDPHILSQIRVQIVDTCIDNCHDYP